MHKRLENETLYWPKAEELLLEELPPLYFEDCIRERMQAYLHGQIMYKKN